METTIRVTAKTIPVDVDVTISVEALLIALKNRCGVYEDYGVYYKVENNKLYRYTDVAYHGSPMYEMTLVSDDENIVAMYNAIVAYEEAYNRMKKCCELERLGME